MLELFPLCSQWALIVKGPFQPDRDAQSSGLRRHFSQLASQLQSLGSSGISGVSWQVFVQIGGNVLTKLLLPFESVTYRVHILQGQSHGIRPSKENWYQTMPDRE